MTQPSGLPIKITNSSSGQINVIGSTLESKHSAWYQLELTGGGYSITVSRPDQDHIEITFSGHEVPEHRLPDQTKSMCFCLAQGALFALTLTQPMVITVQGVIPNLKDWEVRCGDGS